MALTVKIFYQNAGARYGHSVKHHLAGTVLSTSLYAGTGNEVCIGSKSVTVKNGIAAIHHTLVIDVYVLDKEPGAHTVGFKRQPLGIKTGTQFIQKAHRLVVRTVGCGQTAGVPVLVNASFCNLVHPAPYTADGGRFPAPYHCGYLGAVKRSLTDD